MPKKVELLSCGREGLMVVSGCGEKIDSEDGQIIGFERGDFFFFFCVLLSFMYYRVLEKKKTKFLFFFLNDADLENCGASKGFGYIYIYIYKERERER